MTVNSSARGDTSVRDDVNVLRNVNRVVLSHNDLRG